MRSFPKFAFLVRIAQKYSYLYREFSSLMRNEKKKLTCDMHMRRIFELARSVNDFFEKVVTFLAAFVRRIVATADLIPFLCHSMLNDTRILV